MKKIIISILSLILVASVVFTGCSKKETDENVIKIGASPVPHSELLNLIKDDLKADGIELEIIEFNDYIKPNLALADGEIDANFFQHIPYLNDFAKEHELDITYLCGVHIEPLGIYSKKIKSIDNLEKGSTIALPNDTVNQGRAFILLENNGLIKLKEDAGLTATELDVIENPYELEFKPLEAAQIPRILPDVDIAVINGNFALSSNLIPTKDALILEDKESPYVNIVAVRKGEENKEKFVKLKKHLQSDKVKKFIEENYNGGVVPAFK